MRILVSGASGFIGSCLVRQLHTEHDVHALTRGMPPAGFPSEGHWIEQDLLDPLDHSRLPRKIDAVVHLAQSRFYKQFPDRAEDIFAVNVSGTFQLLEYARRAGAGRFVFASSGGVYGYGPRPFVETDPLDPPNFYLSSKCAAESLVGGYRSFFHTAILRLFAVYGPGQRDMLVSTLARKIEHGDPITIEGNPGLRLSPTYIDDAVGAIVSALRLPTSAVVNIAGDEAVTITDLAELIAEAAGRSLAVSYAPNGPPGELVAANGKMREILGIQPLTTLRRGLRSVVKARTEAELGGR